MPLFKRKKQEEVVVDNRTEIEKKFEDTGQIVGKKTGEFVQKSVDKFQNVKNSLEENGTMDKVRNVQTKVDQAVDSVVDTVSKKATKVMTKNKKKNTKKSQPIVDGDFYE